MSWLQRQHTNEVVKYSTSTHDVVALNAGALRWVGNYCCCVLLTVCQSAEEAACKHEKRTIVAVTARISGASMFDRSSTAYAKQATSFPKVRASKHSLVLHA